MHSYRNQNIENCDIKISINWYFCETIEHCVWQISTGHNTTTLTPQMRSFAFCEDDSVYSSYHLLPFQNSALQGRHWSLCSAFPSSSIPTPDSCGPISCGGGRKREERGKLKLQRKWRSTGLWPGSCPPTWPFYLFSSVIVLLCVWPVADKHVPVTQDNSGLRRPPIKHPNTHFGHLMHPPRPRPFSSLSANPFPSFHSDGWWSVQSCEHTVLSWCEPNPSGAQYPVYQLSALWKPQQYWAEAEVQNSLQFAQVTAKVEVVSVTLPSCLQKGKPVTAALLKQPIHSMFCVILCELISQQPRVKPSRWSARLLH